MSDQLKASSADPHLSRMARHWYGFGRWDCPYWFIGPEPGQALAENHNLQPRLEAWLHSGAGELCDCRDFHDNLAEKSWHREKPRLQPTWRPLMLLLMSFLGRPADGEALRDYQRSRWGRSAGETCVIELSGLAANSLNVPRQRTHFREVRVTTIRERLLTHKPRLVVMYGKSEQAHWEQIAEHSFADNSIVKVGPTVIALASHPTSRGLGNAYWKKLGEGLREEANRS